LALLAWYKLDENAASSTAIADSSGNGLNGTAARNTDLTAATGKVVGGYQANGSSDYIDIGNVADAPSAMTVACWVKAAASGTVRIVSRLNGGIVGSTAKGWLFQIGSANYLQLATYSGATYAVIASHAFTTTNWNHVAVTLDGTTGAFFINGVLETDSSACIAPATHESPTTIARMYIGAAYYYGAAIFDDMRIYNTALTAGQIKAIYNSDTGSSIAYPWGPKLLAARRRHLL
jgi:hypothetical protein